ncbi:hypothetical protein [Streptomyces mirabilis]|uniref:hypothetical protein n=1 Tax=Streptomyces mirabilis TaxID=68239 RepID=UPI003F4D3735
MGDRPGDQRAKRRRGHHPQDRVAPPPGDQYPEGQYRRDHGDHLHRPDETVPQAGR